MFLYKPQPPRCEAWPFGRRSISLFDDMTYHSFASQLTCWVLASLGAALLLPGCATTATATAWRPAEIDVEGMQRLAVLNFSGERGQAVAASLTTRLWENEFYLLVDQSDLQPVRMASARANNDVIHPVAYLDSARSQQINGIIVGDVIEYRCDDQILSHTDIHVGAEHAQNQRRRTKRDGVGVGVSHNQSIHREATVSIAFRLVEVDTGNVRATRKTTHNFQGDFAPGQGCLPAKGEVLDELTQRCIDEFVVMLAPHKVELRMPLASSHLFQRGQALVGKGKDFAKRGRWVEATAAWEQALDANPTNDAALYNLAVARAARHDYTKAEEFAIRALNVKHRAIYADGLDQIRQLAADHEQSLRQRQQSNLCPFAPRTRQLMSSSR